MKQKGLRVLVLCTGNSCRSQMAEAFIRKGLNEVGKISSDDDVASAGIEAHGLNPRAVATMKEIGIDISGHTSESVDSYLGREFDFVITVCDKAAERCPVFPGPTIRLHWPFDDPANATGTEAEIMAAFRRVRDLIGAQVKSWLESVSA